MIVGGLTRSDNLWSYTGSAWCDGRGRPRWANCLAAPFVLLWQSFSLYVLGCCGLYVSRLFNRAICRCCGYRDEKFLPGAESLGALEKLAGAGVTWETPSTILQALRPAAAGGAAAEEAEGWGEMQLFQGKIEPSDLKQGSLGDCWLISGLVQFAHQLPHSVQLTTR